MVTHAAGESAFRAWHVPDNTTAIVLGVDSEDDLLELERNFELAGMEFCAIREPSPPWNNALLSIGIVPGERNEISPFVAHLSALKELSPNPSPRVSDSALKSTPDSQSGPSHPIV